jgi:hypothetical protein
MRDKEWDPISLSKLTAFTVGMAAFLVIVLVSPPGFVFLLDFANLLFHEAGHPAFGILNSQLGVYGGTLGQLTFPFILMISFWRKAQPIPFAACWIWFFENWLNIARYMADSRALELPLVGGGDHDWNEIFFRWNVLSYDTLIANITRRLGWLGMIAAVLWILWRAWIDSAGRERTGSAPLQPRKSHAEKAKAWHDAGKT